MPAGSKVGLVLGAGGIAGGAFHAGVLAALEEATGWDPRRAGLVVGTSAGSIAGAALRAGLSASDMLARAEGRRASPAGERLMRHVPSPPALAPLRPTRETGLPAQVVSMLTRAVARPFAARPWALLAGLLPEGAVSTEVISGSVGSLWQERWPDDPLWICAVRHPDGRRVVFGRGTDLPPVPVAVAASCAIPSFFQPVSIDGQSFVDGGVHSPTNADVLRHARDDLGLDLGLVLVSSPMSLTGRGLRWAGDQPIRRWSRLLLDTEARRLRRAGLHVLAFQPTPDDAAVMGVNAMDPARRSAVARQAYESTLRRLARADTRERLTAFMG